MHGSMAKMVPCKGLLEMADLLMLALEYGIWIAWIKIVTKVVLRSAGVQ